MEHKPASWHQASQIVNSIDVSFYFCRAPEFLDPNTDDHLTSAVDIYSMGVIIKYAHKMSCTKGYAYTLDGILTMSCEVLAFMSSPTCVHMYELHELQNGS